MTTNTLIDTLVRHGIGYDTLANFSSIFNNGSNFPPHDILKTGEDRYRLQMAVAGFTQSDLSMELHDGLLTVSGHHEVNEGVQYLYRGIATRDFQRAFKIGEHVHVKNARLENGLLTVDLARELPEALRPQTIPILAAA